MLRIAHKIHNLYGEQTSREMDCIKQTIWATSLSVGEVMPSEMKNLYDLICAIFVETVSNQIEKLRTEKCCGCEVNHPSQRRHDFLMITEQKRWITHGLEAIERAIDQDFVWKQFVEAIRVMKPNYHMCATEHYNALKENQEATLDLLMDLKESSNLSDYRPIVHYLSYCIDEH